MDTAELWRQFHDRLLGYIIKKVHNEELAHDLLQEVFIKIHLKIHTLQSNENISSWVFTITKNTIVDHYRSKSDKTSPLNENYLSDEFPEEELNEAEYCEECLKPFVYKLPEQYKEAILATDLGPYTQKEYAHELGISYSGLKSRVQRGRRQLFDLFSNCCKEKTDLTHKTNTLPCGCPT